MRADYAIRGVVGNNGCNQPFESDCSLIVLAESKAPRFA